MITFQDQIFMQFLTGFSVVAILIIAAIGLAIIFGVAGVINMAHGEFIMIGAYCGYFIQQFIVGPDFAYTLFLAVPFAFVVVGLIGLPNIILAIPNRICYFWAKEKIHS